MVHVRLWWMFIVYAVCIEATTHWMVTESGLIQPRLESPFELNNSFDLISFLNQDTRWENIINLYHDLSKRQAVIDKLWRELDRETDLNKLIYKDKNCLNAEPFGAVDWYASLLEDFRSKNLFERDFSELNYVPYTGLDINIPDCKKISKLYFSMAAFDHLEGVIKRKNLSVAAEGSIPEQISQIMTVDQFSHLLATMLHKNSSSWLNYNMASLFWRAKGNGPQAMECSRRAVHHAPREYKSIALLSMGSILHRGKFSQDAAIVLEAAADHDPKFIINHFLLANTHAVNGDFALSVRHYNECLKLKPDFEYASKYRFAVLCSEALLKKMKSLFQVVTELREELTEYSERESHWLKTQAALLRAMKHKEDYDAEYVEKNCEKMSELTGLNIKGLKSEGDKNSVILHFLKGPMYKEQWLNENGVHIMPIAFSLSKLIKHIGVQKIKGKEFQMDETLNNIDSVKLYDGTILKEIGPMTPFTEKSTTGKVNAETKDHKATKQSSSSSVNDMAEFDVGPVLYPPTMKVNRNSEIFDKEPDFPSDNFCLDYAHLFPRNLEDIVPVFLPFENKGIKLGNLLTDKIGVPANVEHELPWHPPICQVDREIYMALKKLQKQQLGSVTKGDYLLKKLLQYVGDGNIPLVKHMQDIEIGQRIYAAMQMKLAPKWLLNTLASLYWRVRGNNANALNCLLSTGKVPTKYREIVLVSTGSVYLEMGYFDEALNAAEDAFRLNLYEPATNFLLGQLSMIKKHRSTHIFHLRQAVRIKPGFMDGLVRNLVYGWSCLLKQINAFQEDSSFSETGNGEVCRHVPPNKNNMACEKDDINCNAHRIQCFSARDKDGNVINIKEYKEEEEIRKQNIDFLEENTFDRFLLNMPHDRKDKVAHGFNFDAMMKFLEITSSWCGDKNCRDVVAQGQPLMLDECTYQNQQLDFWLNIVSFRQLISDTNLKLPSDITTITPSNKKIPECRTFVNPSDDFFLERMSTVDTEGWEPITNLMHQFTEMFELVEFPTLGAKIANYLDTRPKSWLGALGAGWWCGAGGRGMCALRCLSVAFSLAPAHKAVHALRALASLLHMQSKHKDAKHIAYLSFYMSPKSSVEAFLAAVSHTYLEEYEQAVWMFKFSMKLDEDYTPAKACLHCATCLWIFGDLAKGKPKESET